MSMMKLKKLLCISLIFIGACTLKKNEVEEKELFKQKLQEADELYLEKRQYRKAIEIYNELSFKESTLEQQLDILWKIATIYRDQFGDLQKTILHFEKIVSLEFRESKLIEASYQLARSYFNIGNSTQAEFEISALINRKLDIFLQKNEQLYRFQQLYIQILISNKKNKEAIAELKYLCEEYQSDCRKDNLEMNIALLYEEMGDINEALKVFEFIRSYHKFPDFIDLQTNRLKTKQKLQPLSKGFKK
jgi:tetratricopeptide (TPR) repeat protein